MKHLTHCAVGMALCWTATDARANFACQANPSDFLGIDAGGTVLTSIEGTGRVKVCNLELEQAGITAKVCAGWYSALLSARMSRTKITMYFDESNPQNAGAISCTTLGEWTVRAPYYIEFHP